MPGKINKTKFERFGGKWFKELYARAVANLISDLEEGLEELKAGRWEGYYTMDRGSIKITTPNHCYFPHVDTLQLDTDLGIKPEFWRSDLAVSAAKKNKGKLLTGED